MTQPTKKIQRGKEKTARLAHKITGEDTPQRKPTWIRVKSPVGNSVNLLKATFRQHHLHTVCEEATCPNLNECFAQGTATFLIMGNVCTRRCPFCDVAHGVPDPLDSREPQNLAQTVSAMHLVYVVITSVNRDDLADGGAGHFVACIEAVRQLSPQIRVEVLVPDFRQQLACALQTFTTALPDVFNHNLETVPRLYSAVRPGANYQHSLSLLQRFKQSYPQLPTKSGLMLGLGEEITEVYQVMQDLRAHGCNRLTLGQYLQPSRYHLPVQRYVTPAEFKELAQQAYDLGFDHVLSGPLVRSSYHAAEQVIPVRD
jgi:lipoic acid synthetase